MSVICKVLAWVLRCRILPLYEGRIVDAQLGFRPHRSTSQALYSKGIKQGFSEPCFWKYSVP